MEIKMMSSNKSYEVTEVGITTSKQVPVDILEAGDVGLCS